MLRNINISRNPWLHAALIALLGMAAYANSFSVPFQFDDSDYILNNPAIRNVAILLEPSKIGGHVLYHYLLNRYVGFMSFSANYALHGASAWGYHAVNLAIHIANALLLYALIMIGWRSPRMKRAGSDAAAVMAALSASMLFVAHPMMTQAVTYISQRFTSLATMFYLASMCTYALARIKTSRKAILLCISFLCGALAMKTKEISLTLPFALALFEFMLFEGPVKKRINRLAPFMLLALVIPLTVLFLDRPLTDFIGDILDRSRADTSMPRHQYLFTQFVVIMKYLGLFILPAGLNLDHDQQIHTSLAEPAVLFSLTGLLGIALTGLWAARRLRCPLAAFGLLWFFLSLSVESSILPIRDVMFEHRMYLPSAGLLTFALCSVFSAVERPAGAQGRKIVFAFVTLIALALCGATIARNTVWQNPISLWEDVAQKSPRKPRAYTNLGYAYMQEGMPGQAILNYKKAIAIDPRYSRAYAGLGAVYLQTGMLDPAVENLRKAVSYDQTNDNALFNLGSAHFMKKEYALAISKYSSALDLQPLDADIAVKIGQAYQRAGDPKMALVYYRRAIRISPSIKLPLEAKSMALLP